MGKNIDKRVWGVLGKQQTYYSPQKQVEGKTKTPLNANAFDSWDAKRSRFKRVDGYENAVQQGGAVPQISSTPVVSTPTPTPSITPTITTTPNLCKSYTIQSTTFTLTQFDWTNCDGTPGIATFLFPNSATYCALAGTMVITTGTGTITDNGLCPTPTPSATPTLTPTPSSTPLSQSVWNGNTTDWNNETDNWETA